MEDPVRWTLDQLKTRFSAMIKQAGYEEIAEKIDQQAIGGQLTRLEPFSPISGSYSPIVTK